MENVIQFYTIHCPMCSTIQRMMDMKKIKYQTIDNNDEVIKKADELNITSAPFLIVDGEVYVESALKTWIKEYNV